MSSFTGTWDVVCSPDFDDDYLHMEVRPYVKLSQQGKRVAGEYHLGLQTGNIDGRLESDRRVIFSFEGMDEMDPVGGAGTATIEGDRMVFTLMYHQGDDYTFECKRHSRQCSAASAPGSWMRTRPISMVQGFASTTILVEASRNWRASCSSKGRLGF